jgi:hypothetical protein
MKKKYDFECILYTNGVIKAIFMPICSSAIPVFDVSCGLNRGRLKRGQINKIKLKNKKSGEKWLEVGKNDYLCNRIY